MTVNISLLAGAGWQFFDNNGIPLAGGLLYTYAAGTTTPQTTYTTNVGNIANSNPIVLDSAGRTPNEIWLTSTLTYKFLLKNSSGTQIASYDNIAPAADSASLAASGGSSLIGYLPGVSGAIATTVQSKLRESVSVKDFGVVGDGVNDDTAALQAAFDSGVNQLIFTCNCYVTEVTIGGTGRTIDFNGYAVIGTNTGLSLSAPLNINGTYLTLINVLINANFKSYNSVCHWFTTGSITSQNIYVYGMVLLNGIRGLTYGSLEYLAPGTGLNSENTIFGLMTRAVQVPFQGNQTNGFITLVCPQLDCAPYEWVNQAGYDATTYNTAARVIDNRVGVLMIQGGELLKTISPLGWSIYGNSIFIEGSATECAASHYATGSMTFLNTTGGYMGADGISVVTVDVAAVGTLTMTNTYITRAELQSSGQHIFRVSDSAAIGTGGTNISANYTIVVSDSYFGEWQQWVTMLGTLSHFENFNPVVRNMRISNSGVATDVFVYSNYLKTAYSGGIFAGTGTLTTAAATGTVTKNGNVVTVNITYSITTNGTGAGYILFVLPYLPTQISNGCGMEITASTFVTGSYAEASNGYLHVYKVDGTYPGGNGYGGQHSITYTTTSDLV
tara:strand:+ start:993 stop:2834 length:1842 start_codon:yes stop_codon:yes gene_type:complete